MPGSLQPNGGVQPYARRAGHSDGNTAIVPNRRRRPVLVKLENPFARPVAGLFPEVLCRQMNWR